MEEFEIRGAREWLVEGSTLPSRPKGSGTLGHLDQTTRNVQAPQPATTTNHQGARYHPQQRTLNGQGRGMPTWVRGPNHGNQNRQVTGDSPSKVAWRAGRACNGKFRLLGDYGQFKQRIADYATSTGSSLQGATSFFDEVSRRSGAYIPVPKKDTEREICIWGNYGQLRTARTILSQLVRVVPPIPKKKSDFFAKTVRYSEEKLALAEQAEKHSTVLQQRRQKPDDSMALSETMLFLWPIDELPFEASLGSNLEDLDPLRREFDCYIYLYDEDPSYIRVDTYEHETVRAIVHRLRAKWAELMANRHIKLKLYLAQPPVTNQMTSDVQVHKVSQGDNGDAYNTPLLYCIPTLTALHPPDWKERVIHARAKNEGRLREGVERSLQGLRFLRGHVRMRVNFGSFILEDYRLPKDSKSRYSFEEFRSMLFYTKTKGRVIPGLGFQHGTMDLISKCAAATELLSPYEATAESLEEAEALYAVNFEFVGENEGLLRLEAEFSKSPGSGLFEVYQKRWVNLQDKSGDKRPPLQIAVIDFDSSDWQLEIKALNFHEPESINQSLRTFSHSIKFTLGPTDGLRGEGKRRVTFSEVAPVAKFVEKSALRYRLKGTNYVLELARYDEYRRFARPLTQSGIDINMGTTYHISEEPITTWGASVFDLQWDNTLGKHANFGLGHAADWSPSLNTFFPCSDDPSPSDVRLGFNQFVDLTQRVASLLGPEEPHSKAIRALQPIPAATTSQSQPVVNRLATANTSNGPLQSGAPATIRSQRQPLPAGVAPGPASLPPRNGTTKNPAHPPYKSAPNTTRGAPSNHPRGNVANQRNTPTPNPLANTVNFPFKDGILGNSWADVANRPAK